MGSKRGVERGLREFRAKGNTPRSALPNATATSPSGYEHLKCGWSKLRWAIGIRYTLDFEDLVQKKKRM